MRADHIPIMGQFRGHPVLNVGAQFGFIFPLLLRLKSPVLLKRQAIGLCCAALLAPPLAEDAAELVTRRS